MQLIEAWSPAVLPIAIAVLLIIVPGLIVIVCGWGFRRIGYLLLAPATTIALYSLSAILAPVIGLRWSLLPALITTLVVAGLALIVRARAGERTEAKPSSIRWTALATFVAAASLLLLQFLRVFGAPENISQRFDNIVHLNTIQYVLLEGSASAFDIGATSDIVFYPNGWHSFTSLVAEVAGSDVPLAVNAANLAVAAVLWPASALALSWMLFRARPAAMITTGAMATAFGAFPGLLHFWGVLYPNIVGYAMIPAVLAVVTTLTRKRPGASRLRNSLLLALIVAGTGLAHPNAFLAAYFFAAVFVCGTLICVAARERSTRSALVAAGSAGIGAVGMALLWHVGRTSASHSAWESTQTLPQAVGGALLASPLGDSPTPVIVVLLVAGLITVVRRPARLPLALPYLAAGLMFVAVTGLPTMDPFRIWLTNPWYSDWYRFAALLPIATIPVLALGAITIADLARSALAKANLGARKLGPVRILLTALGAVIVFSAWNGSSVAPAQAAARGMYMTTETSMLSTDERALLERLDESVPEDALIIGSPRTGASLVYAISGRETTELHIFGSPSDDEVYLDRNLDKIGDDADVCAAVNRTGVDFVLDFGSIDLDGKDDPAGYAGIVDLQPSDHLELVDSQGDDARLFRIEGC